MNIIGNSFVNKIKRKLKQKLSIIDLKSAIDSFCFDFFLEINKSILSGEYISEKNVINEKYTSNLNDLETFFKQDYIFNFEVDEEQEAELDFLLELVEYYKNVYELFILKTEKLFCFSQIDYVDRKIYINPLNPLYTQYSTFLDLFEINIEISKIDQNFLTDKNLLKQLFNLKNKLNNQRISFEILNDELKKKYSDLKFAIEIKLNFLIDKWYIRYYKKNGTQDSFEYFKYFNSYNSEVNCTNLEKFKDKIIFLYEIDDFPLKKPKTLITSEITRFSSNLDTLNFFKLHTLIKYYKDYEKNLKELEKIKNEFKERKNQLSSKNVYNSFFYNISYQYSLNNCYSLYCELFEQDFLRDLNNIDIRSKLNEFYNSYKEVLLESENLSENFFLQYKFIHHSLRMIDLSIKKTHNNPVGLINQISSFFNEDLNNIIIIYNKKINWSLKHQNYIFKLPHEESLITFKDLKIYLSSSFLLPIDEEDIQEKNNILDRDFKRLRVYFDIENQLKEIANIKTKFSSEISTLKSKIDNDNKKLIESVTIFTAIISFIVGSIGAYKFLTTFTEAIIFIIVFGISISIFVLLIFISTKGIEALKKYKLSLIGIYVLALIILIILIPFNYHSTEYIENSNKSRDSLHNSQERKIENLEKLILLNKSSQN